MNIKTFKSFTNEQLVNESMTKYATMIKNKAKLAQDTLNGLGIENSIIPASKGPAEVFNGDKQLYDIMIDSDVLSKENERIKLALEYLEDEVDTNEKLFQTDLVDSEIESIATEIKGYCDKRMHIDFVYEVLHAASKVDRHKVLRMLDYLKGS